jgi:hypothetical protein
MYETEAKMKTKFVIEVETKDHYGVWPDHEKTEEDYTKEELKKHQEEFTKGIHKAVVEFFERFSEEDIEEQLLESTYLDDYSIEGWDDMEDYGIKITVKKQEGEK